MACTGQGTRDGTGRDPAVLFALVFRLPQSPAAMGCRWLRASGTRDGGRPPAARTRRRSVDASASFCPPPSPNDVTMTRRGRRHLSPRRDAARAVGGLVLPPPKFLPHHPPSTISPPWPCCARGPGVGWGGWGWPQGAGGAGGGGRRGSAEGFSWWILGHGRGRRTRVRLG